MDVDRSGDVFDAAEEVVDRVGFVDLTGMDAETDDEILAGSGRFGDVKGEIKLYICFGEPTFGAVADDFDGIAEEVGLAGAVARDRIDLIVSTLNHCDKLVGRHVGNGVERSSEDFDFRRREDGKQCPTELLAEDRNAAVVLGDPIGDLDLAALAPGFERAGDGVGRTVRFTVGTLREGCVADNGGTRFERKRIVAESKIECRTAGQRGGAKGTGGSKEAATCGIHAR